MKTSNIIIFQLDSDKQSFGLDNVPTCIRIKAAIIKIQCFENKIDFFCTLNENMSHIIVLTVPQHVNVITVAVTSLSFCHLSKCRRINIVLTCKA